MAIESKLINAIVIKVLISTELFFQADILLLILYLDSKFWNNQISKQLEKSIYICKKKRKEISQKEVVYVNTVVDSTEYFLRSIRINLPLYTLCICSMPTDSFPSNVNVFKLMVKAQKKKHTKIRKAIISFMAFPQQHFMFILFCFDLTLAIRKLTITLLAFEYFLLIIYFFLARTVPVCLKVFLI